MHAQVGTVRDADLRVKIVEERARFDSNPKDFRSAIAKNLSFASGFCFLFLNIVIGDGSGWSSIR
jgi:hypothetical protein